MGLLDQIGSGLGGKGLGGSGQSQLMSAVLNLINSPQTGGISGLIQAFKTKGLGDVVSSWIGTGENRPVSGQQIQDVLGDDQVQQIADQAGTSKEEASGGLAQLLPEIIDKLTPNGQVPEGGVSNQGLDAIKSKFLGG